MLQGAEHFQKEICVSKMQSMIYLCSYFKKMRNKEEPTQDEHQTMYCNDAIMIVSLEFQQNE